MLTSLLCWQAPGDDVDFDGDDDLDDIVRSLRKDKQALTEQQSPSAELAATPQDAPEPLAQNHHGLPARESGQLAQPSSEDLPGSCIDVDTARRLFEQPRVTADPSRSQLGVRAAAAGRAMQADAPELLDMLKQHGIADRLALLDDSAAGGGEFAAPAAPRGKSALSQVR
jgi:hypothetical protein